MTTNVPIPGRPTTPTPKSGAGRRQSRRSFYFAVAVLAITGVASVSLVRGEPWNLSPDQTSSITKSVIAVIGLFVLVIPAFAWFRYEKASAGDAWHEPSWRPSAIGMSCLLMAMSIGLGWHALRLAILIARQWTEAFG